MNPQNVVSEAKTLRVVLSPKIVQDFYMRNNKSSDLNRKQENNGGGSASTADNSIEPIRKTNFHDSEIVDSGGKKPVIWLNRFNPNEIPKN